MTQEKIQTSIQKQKLLETGKKSTSLKFLSSLVNKIKKSSSNRDLKSTDGELNGKKGNLFILFSEVLVNWNSSKTNKINSSEYSSELRKHTKLSSTTSFKPKTSSVNWNNSKPATTPGLGPHMMFQMRSQQLRSFAQNSLQKKTSINSRKNLRRLANTMLRFWLSLKPKKKPQRSNKQRKNNKPRRNNEYDGLYVFTLR